MCSSESMKLSSLVPEDRILAELRATDRKGVLRELGHWFAAFRDGPSEEEVTRALSEREELGSTSIGEQAAVPHAKLPSVSRLLVGLARSPRGIDFGSPDGRPTHLFFVLLAPESAPGEHLKALARISRLCADGDLRKDLLAAEDAEEMHRALAEREAG